MEFDYTSGIRFLDRRHIALDFWECRTPIAERDARFEYGPSESVEAVLATASVIGEAAKTVTRFAAVFHVVGTALELMRRAPDPATREAVFRRLRELHLHFDELIDLPKWDRRTIVRTRGPGGLIFNPLGVDESLAGPKVVSTVIGEMPGLMDGAKFQKDWNLALTVKVLDFPGRPPVHALEAFSAMFVLTASAWSGFHINETGVQDRRVIAEAAADAAYEVEDRVWTGDPEVERNRIGMLAYELARFHVLES